jgi:hypothetical protein
MLLVWPWSFPETAVIVMVVTVQQFAPQHLHVDMNSTRLNFKSSG